MQASFNILCKLSSIHGNWKTDISKYLPGRDPRCLPLPWYFTMGHGHAVMIVCACSLLEHEMLISLMRLPFAQAENPGRDEPIGRRHDDEHCPGRHCHEVFEDEFGVEVDAIQGANTSRRRVREEFTMQQKYLKLVLCSAWDTAHKFIRATRGLCYFVPAPEW